MGRRRRRAACEGCLSIDVRLWHREGRLRPNNRFTWSFWIDGRPSGGISVHVQADSVILKFKSRKLGSGELVSIDQRVPINGRIARSVEKDRGFFARSVVSAVVGV